MIYHVVVIDQRDWTYHGCVEAKRGWRCGKCGRGLVLPKKREKCRVCGAKIIIVHSSGGD